MEDPLAAELCDRQPDPEDPAWRRLVDRFLRERVIPEIVRRWDGLTTLPDPATAEERLRSLSEELLDGIAGIYERLLVEGVPSSYCDGPRQRGVPLERFLTKWLWRKTQHPASRRRAQAVDDDAECEPEPTGTAADADPAVSVWAAEAPSAAPHPTGVPLSGWPRLRLSRQLQAWPKPYLCGALLAWPRLDGTQDAVRSLCEALLAAIPCDRAWQALNEEMRACDAPLPSCWGDGRDPLLLLQALHEFAWHQLCRKWEAAEQALQRARAAADPARCDEACRALERLAAIALLMPAAVVDRRTLAAFLGVDENYASQLVVRFRKLVQEGLFVSDDPRLAPERLEQLQDELADRPQPPTAGPENPDSLAEGPEDAR